VAASKRQRKCAVLPRRDLQNISPGSIEVIEHELAVAVATCDRAGISIDAQNRRRCLRAVLPDDQPPGVLAFRAFVGNVPQPGDIRNLREAHGRVLVRPCLDLMKTITLAAVRPLQDPIGNGRVELRRIVLETYRDGISIEIACGRGDTLVPVEERGSDMRAFTGKLDGEGDLIIVKLDGRIPAAAEILGHSRSGQSENKRQRVSRFHTCSCFLTHSISFSKTA
jgi:hypothetical protein